MDKKFFNIMSILLASILFILPCGVCAYESLTSNEMEALSVLPFGIDERDMDRYVSRAEFAYMASRLIECRDMEKTDTRFDDVSKENEYSGYVEFMAQRGIINGVTETQFNPDGSLSSVMAYKVFAKILGYSGLAEELGGYPKGYIKIADYLELTSLAAAGNENLTLKEAVNLVHHVLTEEYPVVLMGEKNGEQILYSGEGTFSILGRLKISAYTGYIREVSSDNKTAVFEIAKNNYNTNYIELNRGELKRFNLKNNIDAYHYKDVPVSVCVDENENIIGIKENKHYKIVYTYITAVNGNKNKSAYYAPSAMEYISLADFDGDFDISEKFSLRVAGIERIAQTKLCGTFAKVVLSDDEVYLIDSWPVSEGGIITDINADGIVYTYQNGLTKKLKNVSDYKIERIKIAKQMNENIRLNSVLHDLDICDENEDTSEKISEGEASVQIDEYPTENEKNHRHNNKRKDRRNRRGFSRSGRNRYNKNDDKKDNEHSSTSETVILYNSHEDVKATDNKENNSESKEKTTWWRKLIKS